MQNNNEQIFSKGLPKWPGLLVVGKNVTEEQAKEILIRTDGFWLSSNDREFDRALNFAIYEISCDGWNLTEEIQKEHGLEWQEAWNWKEKKTEKYHLLDLNYLNNSRIVSSWVGGPHGWCDWKGNIGTANYNIGKWPSIQEVYDDWVKIAEAFPFLDLTAQLLDSEIYIEENTPKPVVEFRILNGKVEMTESETLITEPVEIDFKGRFSNPHAERGCTFNQFVEAITYVENKFKILS